MTIEERLEALEQGLSVAKRRNKFLLIGLVILAVAWAFTSTTATAHAQTGENVVRAERFELVDSAGRVRATLGMVDSGPRLGLDEYGDVRTESGIIDGGPMLGLYDENGTLRAGLVVYGTGPLLWLSDINWAGYVYHGGVLDGRPMGGFRNFDEQLIWSAP